MGRLAEWLTDGQLKGVMTQTFYFYGGIDMAEKYIPRYAEFLRACGYVIDAIALSQPAQPYTLCDECITAVVEFEYHDPSVKTLTGS